MRDVVSKLSVKISEASAIGCTGSQLQLNNYDGYWGTQVALNASVVVYPATAKDVAATIIAYNSGKDRHKSEFAFGGGLHSRKSNQYTLFYRHTGADMFSSDWVVHDRGFYG